jgi:hypothetical protein
MLLSFFYSEKATSCKPQQAFEPRKNDECFISNLANIHPVAAPLRNRNNQRTIWTGNDIVQVERDRLLWIALNWIAKEYSFEDLQGFPCKGSRACAGPYRLKIYTRTSPLSYLTPGHGQKIHFSAS